MADDLTGFFRFDTNATQVARTVESAMQQINGALRTPLEKNAVGLNTQAFGQGFERLAQLSDQARQKLRGIFNDPQIAGDPKKLQAAYRQVVQETFGQIPKTIAREAGNLTDPLAARTLPFKQIGSHAAKEIGAAMQAEFKSLGGNLGGGLSLFASNQAKKLLSGEIPLTGLGPKELGPLQQARNKKLLEDLILAGPAPTKLPRGNFDFAGEVTNYSPVASQRQYEERLGISEAANQYREQHLKPVRDPLSGALAGFELQKTDYADRLKQVEAAQRTGQAAADKQSAAVDRETAAYQRLANAMRIVERGYEKVGAFYRSPGGDFFTSQGRQAGADRSQLLERQYQENQGAVANAQRLYANYPQTTAVPGMANVRGLGGDFYKIAPGGGSATRITEDLELLRINEKIAAAINAQVLADERAQLKELERNATAERTAGRHQGGLLGGFFGRFEGGGDSVATGFGRQIASATAFTVAYGSIFALQGVLRDTLHEFLDYQDSLTDLEVATRDADVVTNSFIGTLGSVARVAGDNVGAAMDSAARGVRAFAAATKDPDQKRQAGEATARTAAQLALIANKSLPDATGDLLASATGFELDPRQLDQVVDAVANAKRNVGGDAAQISQGLALISLSAKDAGFNLSEAASIIGLVQARTDESGQAIATRLTRVFQILQGSTGKGLAQDFKKQLDPLGVDGSSSAKQQLEAYSKIFNDPRTTEAQKDRITSRLGGTANLRELLPILKEGDTLQRAYNEALNNGGQGLDEYQRKSENLVGTLKKLKGDVSLVQVELARTGVGDVFGGLVKTLEPAVFAASQILHVFNDLPRPLRTVLGLMVDIALASKAIAIVQGVRGAQGFGRGAAESGASGQLIAASRARIAALEAEAAATLEAATAASVHTRTLQGETVAEAEATVATEAKTVATVEGGAAGLAGRGGTLGGLATLGRFLFSPAGIIGGLALGGLALTGKTIDDHNKQVFQRDQYENSSVAYDHVDGSAESLASAAGELSAAADRISKVHVTNPDADSYQDDLRNRSAALRFFADQAYASQNKLNSAQQKFVFGAGGAIESFDQLSAGLVAIQYNGGTALDSFNALVDGLTTKPPKGKELYTPDQLAGSLYAAYAGAATADNIPDSARLVISPRTKKNPYDASIVPGYKDTYFNPADITSDKDQIAASLNLGLGGVNVLGTRLFPGLGGNAIQFRDAVKAEYERLGIDPTKGINKKQEAALLAAGSSAIDLNSGALPTGDYGGKAGVVGGPEILKSILGASVKSLNQRHLFTNAGRSQLLNGGKLSSEDLNTLLRGQEATDTTPALPALDQQFQAAISAIPKSDDGTKVIKTYADYLKLLNYAKEHTPEASGEQLNALNLLIENASHDFYQNKVNQLDKVRLAAESNQTTKAGVQAVRISYAKTEVQLAHGDVTVLEPLLASLDRKTLDAVKAYLKTAVATARTAYQHALAIVETARRDLAGAGRGGAATPGDSALNKTKKDLDQKIKDLQGFDTALNSTAIGSQEAELSGLGADVAQKAQQRLQSQIDALGLVGDLTDPVEQARDALRAAQLTLSHETDPYKKNADRVAVRQAQSQLESAKFQQRLSDVQTAEQLGRISFQTYIRYLENEHNRLHSINGKTRQQIDEMNTIDQALKDAMDSATGFFNLGDIRTAGLVYQVRRFAGGGGNAGGPGGKGYNPQQPPVYYQNSNNTVTFHGADIGTIKRVVKELLGPTARTHAVRPRRV